MDEQPPKDEGNAEQPLRGEGSIEGPPSESKNSQSEDVKLSNCEGSGEQDVDIVMKDASTATASASGAGSSSGASREGYNRTRRSQRLLRSSSPSVHALMEMSSSSGPSAGPGGKMGMSAGDPEDQADYFHPYADDSEDEDSQAREQAAWEAYLYRKSCALNTNRGAGEDAITRKRRRYESLRPQDAMELAGVSDEEAMEMAMLEMAMLESAGWGPQMGGPSARTRAAVARAAETVGPAGPGLALWLSGNRQFPLPPPASLSLKEAEGGGKGKGKGAGSTGDAVAAGGDAAGVAAAAAKAAAAAAGGSVGSRNDPHDLQRLRMHAKRVQFERMMEMEMGARPHKLYASRLMKRGSRGSDDDEYYDKDGSDGSDNDAPSDYVKALRRIRSHEMGQYYPSRFDTRSPGGGGGGSANRGAAAAGAAAGGSGGGSTSGDHVGVRDDDFDADDDDDDDEDDDENDDEVEEKRRRKEADKAARRADRRLCRDAFEARRIHALEAEVMAGGAAAGAAGVVVVGAAGGGGDGDGGGSSSSSSSSSSGGGGSSSRGGRGSRGRGSGPVGPRSSSGRRQWLADIRREARGGLGRPHGMGFSSLIEEDAWFKRHHSHFRRRHGVRRDNDHLSLLSGLGLSPWGFSSSGARHLRGGRVRKASESPNARPIRKRRHVIGLPPGVPAPTALREDATTGTILSFLAVPDVLSFSATSASSLRMSSQNSVWKEVYAMREELHAGLQGVGFSRAVTSVANARSAVTATYETRRRLARKTHKKAVAARQAQLTGGDVGVKEEKRTDADPNDYVHIVHLLSDSDSEDDELYGGTGGAADDAVVVAAVDDANSVAVDNAVAADIAAVDNNVAVESNEAEGSDKVNYNSNDDEDDDTGGGVIAMEADGVAINQNESAVAMDVDEEDKEKIEVAAEKRGKELEKEAKKKRREGRAKKQSERAEKQSASLAEWERCEEREKAEKAKEEEELEKEKKAQEAAQARREERAEQRRALDAAREERRQEKRRKKEEEERQQREEQLAFVRGSEENLNQLSDDLASKLIAHAEWLRARRAAEEENTRTLALAYAAGEEAVALEKGGSSDAGGGVAAAATGGAAADGGGAAGAVAGGGVAAADGAAAAAGSGSTTTHGSFAAAADGASTAAGGGGASAAAEGADTAAAAAAGEDQPDDPYLWKKKVLAMEVKRLRSFVVELEKRRLQHYLTTETSQQRVDTLLDQMMRHQARLGAAKRCIKIAFSAYTQAKKGGFPEDELEEALETLKSAHDHWERIKKLSHSFSTQLSVAQNKLKSLSGPGTVTIQRTALRAKELAFDYIATKAALARTY